MRNDSGRRSPLGPGGRAPLVAVVVPAVVAAFGLVALAEVARNLLGSGGLGPGPAVFWAALAVLCAWTAWRLVRTAWLVMPALGGGLACVASGRQSLLGPGEVVAVHGDAYGLFLVLVTGHQRVWLWAGLIDRRELLRLVRRANPAVEIDRYAGR